MYLAMYNIKFINGVLGARMLKVCLDNVLEMWHGHPLPSRTIYVFAVMK